MKNEVPEINCCECYAVLDPETWAPVPWLDWRPTSEPPTESNMYIVAWFDWPKPFGKAGETITAIEYINFDPDLREFAWNTTTTGKIPDMWAEVPLPAKESNA